LLRSDAFPSTQPESCNAERNLTKAESFCCGDRIRNIDIENLMSQLRHEFGEFERLVKCEKKITIAMNFSEALSREEFDGLLFGNWSRI
jgi:hypothetical protein